MLVFLFGIFVSVFFSACFSMRVVAPMRSLHDGLRCREWKDSAKNKPKEHLVQVESIKFDDPIPDGITPEHLNAWLDSMRVDTRKRYEMLKAALEMIFMRRPIWMRRSLLRVEEVKSVSTQNLLLHVVSLVAFHYGSGPFRGLLVRSGEWW